MTDHERPTCSRCDGERTSTLSDAIACEHCGGSGREPEAGEVSARLVPTSVIRAAMPWTFLLGQAEVWNAQDEGVIRLVDMDARHRRNTLRWLRRRAFGLALKIVEEQTSGPMAAGGDSAQEAEADWAESMGEDPEGWLESQPLVVALAALVTADEARTDTEANRPRTPEEMY